MGRAKTPTKRSPAKAAATAAPAKAAAPAVAARAVRREFPLLADLPKLPEFKTDARGKTVMKTVVRQDPETGHKYQVEVPVAFDETGELQHRNRFNKVLMYKFRFLKREKAPKRMPITVNDRRFTVLRGEWVVVPWPVVHQMRNNIETRYHQEDDPAHPGRKLTVMEDQLSDTFEARPIDPCDDFDDETAHLPVKGEVAFDPFRSTEEDLPPELRGLPDPQSEERLVARP